MRVSMMVRWSTVALVAMLAAACSDTATAPSKAVTPAPANLKGKALEAWLLENGGPDRDGRGDPNLTDSVWTQDFTIDPTQPNTLAAGENSVVFPANSICDPATSGYGEDMWDAPCDPLQTPLTIHVTWRSHNGHTQMEFEPAMRFVPTSDPSQFVTVTMKDFYNLDPSLQYPIYWYRPTDGLWVNESDVDPSLAAQVDLGSGTVTRRVKHFSGYYISAGDVCDAFTSGSCAPISSFAGYMLGGV